MLLFSHFLFCLFAHCCLCEICFILIGVCQIMLFIPFAVESWSEVLVSCSRLQTFLMLDEFTRHNQLQTADATTSTNGAPQPEHKQQPEQQQPVVRLHHVSAWWSQQRFLRANRSPSSPIANGIASTSPTNGVNGKERRGSQSSGKSTGRDDDQAATLIDVCMECKPATLTALIGPVGSGKSSVLLTILSELVPSQGRVTVRGSIAYAGQSAWIFSGTVRNNILMGKPMDEERFRCVDSQPPFVASLLLSAARWRCVRWTATSSSGRTARGRWLARRESRSAGGSARVCRFVEPFSPMRMWSYLMIRSGWER